MNNIKCYYNDTWQVVCRNCLATNNQCNQYIPYMYIIFIQCICIYIIEDSLRHIFKLNFHSYQSPMINQWHINLSVAYTYIYNYELTWQNNLLMVNRLHIIHRPTMLLQISIFTSLALRGGSFNHRPPIQSQSVIYPCEHAAPLLTYTGIRGAQSI